MYEYRAKVLRVIDGDTIDVELDLGFKIKVFQRLRFAGINAPETRTLDLLEKAEGFKAKQYVIDKIDEAGGYVVVRTNKTGKFGRYIADIMIDIANAEARGNGTQILVSLNEMLVTKGLAVYKEY